MKICRDTNTTLSEFMAFCVEQDSKSETSKFDMRQHIWAFMKIKGFNKPVSIGTDHILRRKDAMFDRLGEALIRNNTHWVKKGLYGITEYCSSHDHIMQLLDLKNRITPVFARLAL